MARLNAFAAAGWTVLRFASDSVFRYPDEIVARVAALVPR
jgi:very-short-patch-repair endonuclease